jgi:hypothetical protein
VNRNGFVSSEQEFIAQNSTSQVITVAKMHQGFGCKQYIEQRMMMLTGTRLLGFSIRFLRFFGRKT